MYLRAGIFALCAVAVQAQRPEDTVVSALRQLEKAEQTGDADAWMALQSSRSGVITHPEAKSIMSRPNPSAHYQVTKVLVDGERAALIATMRDQFLSVRFVLENNQWKMLDTTFSNVPIDPASLYALVPPVDGAFARAGSPWDRVQPAVPNARYFKAAEVGFKLQAVYDESYLYVRIDARDVLPAANTEVQGTFPNLRSGVSRDWPVMKIRIAGAPAREYTFDAADFVGDRATFDESGKASSHHHFVGYTLWVRKGDNSVFSVGASEPERLIAVHDHFVDLKIPLKALGVTAPAKARIEILDANGPVGKFLPYEASWMAP